jgi:hypothetical protein
MKLKTQGGEKKGGVRKGSSGSVPVTAEDVVDFLGSHPGFLRENPQLILDQALPERPLGRNVVDFQEAMIKYLRHEIGHVEALQERLIEATRQNMINQQKVYDCVQSLLEARSFENVVETISTDFPIHLGLTSVVLCMEADADNLHMSRHVGILPRGMVDAALGGKDVVLRDHIFGDGEIFGRVAALIRSDALLRLRLPERVSGAMLAFGSDEEDCFDGDQSPVLIEFLGSCVEQLLDIWLVREK